jgi:hypothetical protein
MDRLIGIAIAACIIALIGSTLWWVGHAMRRAYTRTPLSRTGDAPACPPQTALTPEQRAYDRNERQHMPAELRTARLLLSEETLKCDHPHPLSARIDQLFERPDGRLILVETKTRERLQVDPYDVLELSVQQQVIRRGGDPRFAGKKLSGYAYVRTVGQNGHPQYLAAELVDEETVLAYFKRWHFLTHHQVPDEQMPLRGAYAARECSRCEFRPQCQLQPR